MKRSKFTERAEIDRRYALKSQIPEPQNNESAERIRQISQFVTT